MANVQNRQSSAQSSFFRRPALLIAVRVRTAGAGGEQTAPTKRAFGSLRRGLADVYRQSPQPRRGREVGGRHRRFATGKPSKERQARDCFSAQPARAKPPAIQFRPRDTGCRHGVSDPAFRACLRVAIQARSLASESTRDGARLSVQRILCWTAIQPLRLALVSLRGREGLSFRRASRRTEFAIG